MDETKKPGMIAGLRREVASPDRDILMPAMGGIMRQTDDVIQRQGGSLGLKIYDDLEQDPMVSAVLMKRRMGLVGREWELKPGGPGRQDRKAADLITRILSGEFGLSFDKVCLDLLDATLKGFATAEVIWDYRDGFIVPVAVKPKNQRRFVFDEKSDLRLLTLDNPVYGVELPEKKFLIHRVGDKTGDPYGRGLGYQMYFWVFFKKMAAKFWLTYADKFGSPTVVGEVAEGTLEADEDVLLSKLRDIAQKTAITVPAGTVVKYLEAMRSGTVTYGELIDYCDKMITVAVLGETLTTSAGNSGSRALGEVHAEVKDSIIDADSDLLSATLNSQFLTWITQINYPDARPPTVWRDRPSSEIDEAQTMQARMSARSAAQSFVDGMRTAGWIPADPDLPLEELALSEWTHPGPPDNRAVPPDRPVQLSAGDPGTDAFDHLSSQLQAVAGGSMDKIINRLREIISQSTDLSDAASRLLAEYPSIQTDELGQVMAQALMTSALTGALEMIDD